MKILHLIDSAGLYGAEAVLLHLIAEQRKQGIETILGSIGKPDIKVKNIETAARQRVINVKEFRMKNGPNLPGAISIIRFAKKNHIDLIHCHGYKANILIAMLPARFRKIPYLLTLHGWTSVKKFSKMWFYCWADALFARRVDTVAVVSEAMLNHPRIRAMGLKPAVIHNGIPQTVRKIPGIPDNVTGRFNNKHFTIGSIGRLSPEKGLDHLVNAVANLIDNGRDVSLVIIGAGGEREKLEKLAITKGIIEKVFFLGYLDRASRYFSYFDVFVMSSLTEGMPITLLEAMQAGVPIIATRVGGIPEVLENGRCGLLVNPGDERALSNTITRLYDSPDLRYRLCAAAKERVKNVFSSRNMESGYRKLYENLLHPNNPGNKPTSGRL